MKCPKCHSRAKIYDARQRLDKVWRRHECPNCGFRFTTYETYAQDYTKPRAYIRGINGRRGVSNS
jgi:transcriptional regulator NrdR family protein